jgi:uncharacterized protein YdhG (YjbR/CyaY superfamily)
VPKYKSVDEYIASFDDDRVLIAQEVRSIFNKSLKGYEEVISYNIPGYKKIKVDAYWAMFKEHYSIFLPHIRSDLDKVFKQELQEYKIIKAGVSFSNKDKIPKRLIAKLIKYQIDKMNKAKLINNRYKNNNPSL